MFLKIRTILLLVFIFAALIVIDNSEAQVNLSPDLSSDKKTELNEKKNIGNFTANSYPNIRITDNSGSSENPRLACDGIHCYIVWQDDRDGNWEIYFCKTDHNGIKVFNEVRVCTTGGASINPAIDVDGSGNSYIVWQEGTGWGNIYFCKLDSSGTKVIDDVLLSDNPLCLNPEIATTSVGISNVAYEKRAPAIHYLLYKRLDSNGNQLCYKVLSDWDIIDTEKNPSIDCDPSGNAYVVWRDCYNWTYGLWICRVSTDCSIPYNYKIYTSNDARYPALCATGTNFVWIIFEKNNKIYNLTGSNAAAQISQGSGRNPEVWSDGNNGFATWESNRDANWEIYLCKFYGSSNLSGDLRITNETHESANPHIAGRGTNNWYLAWQDNRDANEEIYWSKNLPCSTITFTVKLKNDNGPDTLARGAVVIIRRGDGSVATDTADDNGQVTFDSLCLGDEIYAYCLVGWGRTDKEASHPLLSKFTEGPSYPAFYEFYKTNQYIDYQDTLRYPIYQGDHEIVLDYKIVYLYLVMSYERAVANPTEELDSLRQKFNLANQFLFDATNGQVLIKTVDVYDWGGGIFKDHADLRVLNNKSRSIAALFDFQFPSYIPNGYFIFADDRFLEDNVYRGTNKTYNFQTALIHELGHYFLNLGEEYRYGTKDRCVSSSESDQKEHRASIMSGYKLGALNHEFCYEVHNSELHWAKRAQNNGHNSRSCWHYLANIPPTYPDSDWIDLFRNLAGEPEEYVFGDTIEKWNPPTLTPGFSYQKGPYLKMGAYLLSSRDSVSVNDYFSYHPTVRDIKFAIIDDDLGRPVKNVNIYVRHSGAKWRSYVRGIRGTKKEPFEVKGLLPDDLIFFAAYKHDPAKFLVEGLSGDPVIVVLNKLDTKYNPITLTGELKEADIKLLEGCVDVVGSSLQLRLKTRVELSSPPVVSLLQDEASEEVNVIMSEAGANSYVASIPLSDSLPSMGILWFSDTLFVCPQVWDAQFVSSDQSNFLMLNNTFELSIPAGALSTDCYVTSISSPLPKDLIEIGAIPLMGCQSIALSEGVDFLSSGYFCFHYGDGLIDSTICLYKWDEDSDNWIKSESNVDTSYVAIFDSISESGLYSVFAIPQPDPRLTVIYPNGGEILDTSRVDTVSWYNDIGSSTDSLHLYLSLDGGWTYPILLYRSINDDTTSFYEWTVLDSTSTKCKILIMYYLPSEDVVYDESDSVFSISEFTSCPDLEDVSPGSFWISHNYPNPFNPVTIIEYALPKDCFVEITIYNILGQKAKTLVHELQRSGHHMIEWDGRNEAGKEVSSGIYFYKIQAGQFSQTKKMVMIK